MRKLSIWFNLSILLWLQIFIEFIFFFTTNMQSEVHICWNRICSSNFHFEVDFDSLKRMLAQINHIVTEWISEHESWNEDIETIIEVHIIQKTRSSFVNITIETHFWGFSVDLFGDECLCVCLYSIFVYSS